MKKIVVLLLSVTLSLSMGACSSPQDAEAICNDCDSKIAKDSKFCSVCGASVVATDDGESSDETTTNESFSSDKKEDTYNPYDYAVIVCQSIKDSLYNPNSIQIHRVYYIDAYWHNYYIDVSAMNQIGGYTRESYEVLFNDDSSLYSFDKVYDLPEIFEEYEYEELDTDIVESKLK